MELLVRYVFISSQINYVHFNRLYAYVNHFFYHTAVLLGDYIL